MGLQELEYSLARRLLDHVATNTTDMADAVMEVPATNYWSPEHYADELDQLFLHHPIALCLSGALPSANSYRTIDMCGTPVLLTRDEEGTVHSFANTCRHRGVRVADG